MTKMTILIFLSIFLLTTSFPSIIAQTTVPLTVTTPTTTPDPIDANAGGELGNPGAMLRFSIKALDTIYTNALESIARAIKSMVIPDVIVPIMGGMLTIKSVRVTEAKISNYERQLTPPNMIRSRLSGGRIVSIGQWQYRSLNGQRQMGSGLFRTIVYNAEVNVTKQLGRTWDAKPSVQVNECKAYLGQFRVEIEGFSSNTTVIEQCDNLMCKRIRSYFEDAVCNTARNYVKETVNQKLATTPTRINLGPISSGNRFVMDYGLLLNEPKVSDKFIQGASEGKVLARGSIGAPFQANDLASFDDRNESMVSFALSDYAFNTLFHHAHGQQYRFSAYEHIPSTSPIKDLLKLECPIATRAKAPKIRGGPAPLGAARQIVSTMCVGSVFGNASTIGGDSGSAASGENDGFGDLIFKSQRPLQVIIGSSLSKGKFGVNGGLIEAYGVVGPDGKRELLGCADVQWMRGDFLPKLSECNITGTVNITDLQLTRSTSAPIQSRLRQLPDPIMAKLAQLAIPLFTETFNVFLSRYGQFPMPLMDGFSCQNPQLRWMQRTMQIDSDVRVLADAIRASAARKG